MIKWLSTLPLLKEIYRQGGIDSFALASKDIWSTLEDHVEKMVEERLKAKMAELLTIVDERHIITFSEKSRSVYLGGVKAEDGQLKNLKSEAEFLRTSALWHILNETPKELAQKAMFVAGESLTDMQKGRTILYTLSTQNRILDMLSAYTQTSPASAPTKGV